MPPFVDFTDQKFGRLTVLERIKPNYPTKWKCRCSCGNITIVTTGNLRTGNTKSCGCLKKETPFKRIINLVGQKFNRLTVVKRVQSGKGNNTRWECQCICGNTTVVSAGHLKNGHTKSCGCLNSEIATKRATIHGMSKSPEYRIWAHMIDRCYNKTDNAFKNYGGRGITVCKKWKTSFMEFFHDVGNRPSPELTIERIDNNRGYSPDNVKWASAQEQANNRRTNHYITINGITKNITQWAKIIGIRPNIISKRLKRGWDPQRAVLQPHRYNKLF